MEKFVMRSMLQVDASPRLKKMLKNIALKEDKSLRAVVLSALADKYPDLKPFVSAELHENDLLFAQDIDG